MMNKQIQLYSIDTRAFYSGKKYIVDGEKLSEQEVNEQLIEVNDSLKLLQEYYIVQDAIEKKLYIDKNNKKPKYTFSSISDYYIRSQNRHVKKYINNLIKKNKPYSKSKKLKEKLMENDYYKHWNYSERKTKTKDGVPSNLEKLKHKLVLLFEQNKDVRELISSKINNYNKISTFDSDLIRTLNIEPNTVTTDIIVIRILHYKVLEQLINDGFNYNNEKYIFFTASAGQIRKKKVVFIKEKVWNEHKDTITCGLSTEAINKSKEQGVSINKWLAYLALTTSATDLWNNFDIDKSIVVEDFETEVTGQFDYIEKKEVTRTNKDGKEEIHLELQEPQLDKTLTVKIAHSDGCGMMLPSESTKNFQFRMPWFKGLLTPVDYISWCDTYNDCNYKVIDIYDKEWDLKKDDIRYIFTKSQFKMWRYYKDWDDYKTKFKKYNCKTNKCNIEEDKFKRPKFCYQMWQTLTDITDKEIKHYTQPIDNLITDAYTNCNTMLEMLDATEENTNKNYLQKCLTIYPELLQDVYIQGQLSDALNSKKKMAKSGKFTLDGASTFIIPDVFAWLQWMFGQEATGLLENNQVHCNLFNTNKYPRLMVNRSPHLYREHGLRDNVNSNDMKNWFITNGIYVSCHDTLSLLLMFDVDGDHATVIADQYLCNIVERNMKGIRPLYYEMGKAKPQEITSSNIYASLTKAFNSGNIGEYSNTITTLWNKKDFTEDTLTAIKIITAQNNYSIDSAKTNEMPILADDLDKLIKSQQQYVYNTKTITKKGKEKQVTKRKAITLPHFFQYAKDNNNTEDITTSTVNRICKNIENIKQGNFNYGNCGKFNYHKLVHNFRIKIDENIINKYEELNKLMQSGFMKCSDFDEEMSKERLSVLIYQELRYEFEDYCYVLNIDIVDATDMVVKYIYSSKRDSRKAFMFNVLGDIIYDNLFDNLTEKLGNGIGDYFQCTDCGKRVKRTNNRQTRCKDCAKEELKRKDRIRKRKNKTA